MPKKNILFFQPSIEGFGGIESVTRLIVKDMSTYTNVSVLEAYGTTDINERRYSLGERSVFFAFRPFKIIARAKALRRYVKDNSIDTVIVSADGMIISSIITKLLFGVRFKVIACIHQEIARTPLFYRILMRLLIRYADMCVAVSRGIHDELQSYTSRKKITHIPNAISIQDCLAKQDMPLEKSDDEKFFSEQTFLAIGRLEYPKAHSVMIEAFKKVRTELPHAKLIILGDGSLREQLSRQIDASNLSDAVHLLGKKSNVFPYLKRATALVQTSYFESFGISIVEALSLGKPVVATDCNFGPREIMEVFGDNPLPSITPYGILIKKLEEGGHAHEDCASVANAILNVTKLGDINQSERKTRAACYDIHAIGALWKDIVMQ